MANPALTLHGHFTNLTAINRETQTWPAAWSSVTGLQWEVAVSPLLGLIDQTRDLLTTRPENDINAFMEYEPVWRSLILLKGIDPDHTMSQSGVFINGPSVTALYLIGTIIRGYPEMRRANADEQVTALALAVAELRQAVLEATDIEDDLRSFLLSQVIEMQNRLNRRQVSGDGPIEALIAETIGSSAIHAGMWKRAMDKPLRVKIVGVFLAYSAFVGGLDTVWDNSAKAIGHVERAALVSHEVIEYVLGDGPKAIESPKANQLESGSSEVVDAEVIDERPASA